MLKQRHLCGVIERFPLFESRAIGFEVTNFFDLMYDPLLAEGPYIFYLLCEV